MSIYQGSQQIVGGTKVYSAAPIGSIIDYLGDTTPVGYLKCNGQSVSKPQYSELYSVIGDKYGATTSDSFTLPNISDKNLGTNDNPVTSSFMIKAKNYHMPGDAEVNIDDGAYVKNSDVLTKLEESTKPVSSVVVKHQLENLSNIVAYNLLDTYFYRDETGQSVYCDVMFTKQKDGTILLQGICDVNEEISDEMSNMVFVKEHTLFVDIGRVGLDKYTTYKLCGIPSSGADGIGFTIGNGDKEDVWDDGSSECQISNREVCSVYLTIRDGFDCDNVVIKPMLSTNLNSSYNDYIPYSYDHNLIKTLNKKLDSSSIANNQTTTEEGFVLDARQANPNITGSLAAQIASLTSSLNGLKFQLTDSGVLQITYDDNQ